MNNKINFLNQLEIFFNQHKTKKYYTTNDVMNLTGISERTMRYRLNELSIKYENVPSLIFKNKRKWKIHSNLLEFFLPKYAPRVLTLSNYNWKTFATWVPLYNHPIEYHEELINDVKIMHPGGKFHYVIEKTKHGINHLHLVSDVERENLDKTIKEIIFKYIPNNECRVLTEDINRKTLTIQYMQK